MSATASKPRAERLTGRVDKRLTPQPLPDDKLSNHPTEDTDMHKHPVIRLHLLLLAATLLLGSVARAQDYLADPDLPAPKHWEGPKEAELKGEAAADQPTMSYPSRDEIDDALARSRYLSKVSRDFAGAMQQLDQLWLRVNFYNGYAPTQSEESENPSASYAKNLDDLMRARVELLQATEDYQAAYALAAYPYFHAGDAHASGQQIAGMGEQLSRAILERAFSPWWEEKRMELDLARSQEPTANTHGLSQEQADYIAEHFGRSSGELAARVRQAIADGDANVISGLGLRATPALAQLVLADLEGTAFALELDPLYALALVDPSGACRLASDHFDAGGQSFRLRVLNMVETYRPFNRGDVWDYPAPYQQGNQVLSHPPRCQVPFWIDLIAKLASDRRTRARVFGLVDEIATCDALTTEMQTSLINAIAESDERDALNILANLDTGAPIETVKPVLEAAMQHTSARVRVAAAQGLLNFADSDDLIAAAQDAQVEVRRLVARSFCVRSVPRANYNNPRTGAQSFTMTIVPTVDQQRSAVLATLLEDTDEQVRTTAAEALPQQDWNFSSGAPYLAAAQTNDPEITQYLLRASFPNRQVQIDVLAKICESSSTQVLAELDWHLYNHADWRTRPEVWGPALLARATDAKTPFMSIAYSDGRNGRGEGPIEIIDRMMSAHLDRTVGGTTVALLLAVELRDTELLSTALSTTDSFVAEALSTFALGAVEDLARLALEDYHDRHMIGSIAQALSKVDWSQNNADPFLALIRDPRKLLEDRLTLARSLVAGGEESALETAFAVLLSEGVATKNQFISASKPFQYARSEVQAEYAARALKHSSDSPGLALALGVALGLNGEDPELYAAAILEPSLHEAFAFTSGGVHVDDSICGDALNLLMDDGEWSEADQALLMHAMNASHRQLYLPAIQFAQRMQDTRNIPILGSILRSSLDRDQQHMLVTALGSYMSRDAGQELVQCLGAAADPNVRGAIQQQLSQIRSYLEEAEFWAGKEKQRATQDNAIAELVSMLDDKDVKIRVAAIDGLASFGAKEHLPRIIRMLNDESNQVRRAAKSAVLLLQNGISSLEDGDE